MRALRQIAGLLSAFLFSSPLVHAQEAANLAQELQVRAGASVEKDVSKVLRAYAAPEVRTDGWNPDRYLLEIGLRYKPIDYFSVRGSLRGDLEETKDGLEHGSNPRLALSGYLPLRDFEADARIMYDLRLGPDSEAEHRLRYRLGIEYGVPKTRFDVAASAEAFHDFEPGTFTKMRYSAGVSYKFYKSKSVSQWVELSYSLDYYLTERLNVHIPGLYYKVRF